MLKRGNNVPGLASTVKGARQVATNGEDVPEADVERISQVLAHLELEVDGEWSPEAIAPGTYLSARSLRRWLFKGPNKLKGRTRRGIAATLDKPLEEILKDAGLEPLPEKPIRPIGEEEARDAG